MCTGDIRATGSQLTGLRRTSSSIKDGLLVEHWDVIQHEATRESSKSGLPMFGEKFGG